MSAGDRGGLPLGNTPTRWGLVAQAFHWLGAAVILLLLVHGWWMSEFAPRAARQEHYALHASLGYTLLALLALRLPWRWFNTVPAPPLASPAWEKMAAAASHWGLYLLMLGAALTGWALAGTMRRPLDSFFGLVRVPQLPGGPDRVLHKLLEEAHEALAWTLAALVAVHVAAAIYHFAVRRDDVMQRMWGRGR